MKVNGAKDEQHGLSYQWPRLFIMALAVCVGCLLESNIASATEAITSQTQNNQVQIKQYPVAQIFTFLFLMLGPFKIIGPFAQITKGADATFTKRLALLSIIFASLALLIAAFLGELILSSYGIPIPVLALAAGIILFLVALQSVLQQFTPHNNDDAGTALKPSMKMAMMPLAFPAIVTPYGIAALVVFLALSQELEGRLIIGGVVLAIMLLNLIVMLMTRHILPVMSVLLPILGAVLGVVQVALGLQIINNSLRAMGVL